MKFYIIYDFFVEKLPPLIYFIIIVSVDGKCFPYESCLYNLHAFYVKYLNLYETESVAIFFQNSLAAFARGKDRI